MRPFGIGETTRRIIGRSIATIISDDILVAAGPFEVCAGLGICQAVRQLYMSIVECMKLLRQRQ